jgi:hypothetical protein
MFMDTVSFILRAPKKSEMSLSNQVKEAVDQASKHLRDALAFAARTEHPITISTISDLLIRLESLECMDEIMQKFGKASQSKEDSPPF